MSFLLYRRRLFDYRCSPGSKKSLRYVFPSDLEGVLGIRRLLLLLPSEGGYHFNITSVVLLLLQLYLVPLLLNYYFVSAIIIAVSAISFIDRVVGLAPKIG